MPVQLLALGKVAAKAQLLAWLASKLGPAARPLLDDPAGALHRVGDVLVWGGSGGRRVLALLEDLSDGQSRIEATVQNIEAAQIEAASYLGALVPLSMFGLGVTALAAHLMMRRLDALRRRLEALGRELADVKAHVQAQSEAHLGVALHHLGLYERQRRDSHLDTALEHGTFAIEVYRRLVQQEVKGARRLATLSHCGRCYLLALMAQARCRVLADDLAGAEHTLAGEQGTLAALARATFEEVLGRTPEVYLAPPLREEGITLEVLAEVYQQAHLAGAVGGEPVRDASQLFERLRDRLFGAHRLVGVLSNKAVRGAAAGKLKLLMACLEEVSRVESLRLRIAEARRSGWTLRELEETIRQALGEEGSAPGRPDGPGVVAYALA